VLNGSFDQPPLTQTGEPDTLLTPTVLLTTIDAGWPFFSGCRGDSGGPVFRQFSPSGSGTVDTIIVAVNSSFRIPFGVDGGLQICADVKGETQRWARVDVAAGWIVSRVQKFENTTLWQPTFLDDGISGASYIKLHGSPCQSDCDCNGDEYCKNPVNDPSGSFFPSRPFSAGGQACSACLAPPIGDCGCVQGQCLPAPEGVSNSCPP
jgi:hypothetical protein